MSHRYPDPEVAAVYRAIAVLCLGHVDAFYPEPLLETLGWDRRRPMADLVYQDTWGRAVPAP